MGKAFLQNFKNKENSFFHLITSVNDLKKFYLMLYYLRIICFLYKKCLSGESSLSYSYMKFLFRKRLNHFLT